MKTLTNTMLLLAVSAIPASALAEALDETHRVASDGTVSVSNVAGAIEISTWDRNEVHLSGYLGTNQELEVNENDQGISFKVVHTDDEDSDESELILVIPRRASIVAAGVSSDISISGSNGSHVSADSVSGDIEVEAESERVDLTVVSGDLSFRGSSSRTNAEAVSGDIELSGISGEVNLQTVSGDANVDAFGVHHGKFESVSGGLEILMDVEDGGKLTVSNMSGDVELILPSSQSAEYNAQSFSGDISSDFGEVKHEKFGPGSHLKHVSGSSGTQIRVDSFSGDIHIGHK
jgi:DUF4097 and DUF4098 domain-containing protein YvlB